MLVDEAFRRVVRDRPHHPAIVYLGETFTYQTLEALVARCAAALAGAGVGAGARVVLYMPNCPQWVVLWLALQRLGAVAVPVTHQYGPRDVLYVLRDAGAVAVCCTDTNVGYVRQVLEAAAVRLVVVTGLADLLPWWKRAFGRLFDRIPAGRTPRGTVAVLFRQLLRGPARALTVPAEGGAPADPAGAVCQLLYTGGTLGQPKGVPITAEALVESMAVQRRNSEPVVPRGTDVVVQGAPLYHILGQALGLGALLAGDTVLLLPRLNLDALLDHVQRYRATTLFGTPTLYRLILEHDRLAYYTLRSLRYCFSGGDVLPGEIGRRWQAHVGCPIYQGYGTTETCGAISLVPTDRPGPEGTVGLVIPTRQVAVVDPESLAPVPADAPGELLVRGAHLPTSYWNKPEESARAFVRYQGAVWYRTGDIVRRDADGWLFFLDRSADVIKHRGYRVAAARVEAVLQEHPAVVAACVVGVPDVEVGERIKAFVVLKEATRSLSAVDLLRWCRERLAPYEVPQYIEFRDMLPKSRVGKLLRRELREEERRKVGQAAPVAGGGPE